MSHKTVAETVSAHVPVAHMEWPDDSAPKLPWACYYLDRDYPICAGDEQVATKHRWVVELYERRRDRRLEDALAASLKAAFASVRREESYIENDNMLLVAFTFYEID